jgi:hypothetical protein
MTKNNITTIEGLAELIHETMASKEDIKDVVRILPKLTVG